MSTFHYYDLIFSEVFVFDDYIINQIREEEKITTSHVEILNSIVNKHFNKKSVIYISNKIKSYFVESSVSQEIEKTPNLSAIIIIANKEDSIKYAKYEKDFFSKPFKICKDLSEAILWADKNILNKK